MPCALSVLLSSTLAGLALLHVYWAFGGRIAAAAAVPSESGRPLFEPGPAACVAVAATLAAAAWIAAARSSLLPWPLPDGLLDVGIWGLACLFAARAVGDFRYVGFFKRRGDSAFARRDSRIYSPLCVLIALLAAGLGLSPG